MALTLVPSFDLTVTFAALDEEGVIVTRQKTYALEGADFAAAQANRALFLADLALATGANIIGHTLQERYSDPVAPTSTFNLYREMLMTVNLATLAGKKASHSVPAPSLNFVSGQSLNLGHADVTAYLNNFLVTGGIATISDGEFMVDANPVVKSRIRQVRSGVSYA